MLSLSRVNKISKYYLEGGSMYCSWSPEARGQSFPVSIPETSNARLSLICWRKGERAIIIWETGKSVLISVLAWFLSVVVLRSPQSSPVTAHLLYHGCVHKHSLSHWKDVLWSGYCGLFPISVLFLLNLMLQLKWEIVQSRSDLAH